MRIVGIEFNRKESLEPNSEKLADLLSKTGKAFEIFFSECDEATRATGLLEQVLALARPAISVLQNCFKLVKKVRKSDKRRKTGVPTFDGPKLSHPPHHKQSVNRFHAV